MKAISLWQPWASLWCSPRKVHETRHWPTRHRGWLAVHAAKRLEIADRGTPLHEILDDEFGGRWAMDLPRGAIIGMVNLVDCIRTNIALTSADDKECGDFGPDRWAWKRADFVLLPSPIPWRGSQGMFAVPDELGGISCRVQLAASPFAEESK